MGRRAAVTLLVLIAIAAVVWFGGRGYLAKSVAQSDGRVDVNVSAPVEITFDAKGIPQIWAKTDGDAYFAIGWLHASERLFQMELVRRLARGELSEVFGEAAFETDKHQRTIGFARRVRVSDLSPAGRAAMQRYIDGVNAWIAQANVLPPEFVLLRTRPRSWTLEDCLTISAYQTWFSHELMDQDRRYQRLAEKIGAPANALMHAGHPWSFSTVDSPTPTVEVPTMSGASNSWAVAPARSKSGKALHAADPHLAVNQAPGLWYLAGLHSEEGLNVVGATYGGAPFVVMGHNADIAFSFTVASIDLIDYFDDAPANAVRRFREEIRVKGEEKARVVEVLETARGVLVDDKTSLRWAGFDFSAAHSVDAAIRMQHAKTFDDFRGAVTGFGALDANWVYSDRAGSVGYQLGAPIPVRDYDSYVRQKSGAWTGYRTGPHSLNPPKGFVASCNNQVAPEPIPAFYDPYRITRANALLGGTRKLDASDMHAFQLDEQSGLALRWKKLAGLDSWDGRMSADSKEAALFGAWWSVLPRVIFEDEMGEEWKTGRALLDQALTIGSPVLDDKRTPRVETREEIAQKAMAEARRIANARTWGEANTLLVRHPLARVKILDRWLRLNRGPLPAPGDAGTLNANFYSFDEKTSSFRSAVGPSMRFVLDWSDPDSFTLTGALGQSGNPFSPHYDDFLEMARRGEAWTVPFSREKVFATARSRLRLE